MKVVHLVHWKKSGIYVAVESLQKEGVKYGDTHVIEVLRQNESGIDKVKSIFIFLKFLIKIYLTKVDAINLHSPLPYLIKLFYFGNKSSIFFHSNYPFLTSHQKRDRIKQIISKFTTRNDNVIAVSHTVKDIVDRSLNVDCKVAFNIINFIPSNRPTTKVTTLGSAGRFDPEKRFDSLVYSLATSAIKPIIYLAGDGLQLSALLAYSESNKLENINFIGRKLSMNDFYSTIDAYICCSKFEGFGLAIAEAISAQKIIISTKVGILCEKYPFEFIELSSNLNNLESCIQTALNLKSEAISRIVRKNLDILHQHFSNAVIYKMYSHTQTEIHTQ